MVCVSHLKLLRKKMHQRDSNMVSVNGKTKWSKSENFDVCKMPCRENRCGIQNWPKNASSFSIAICWTKCSSSEIWYGTQKMGQDWISILKFWIKIKSNEFHLGYLKKTRNGSIIGKQISKKIAFMEIRTGCPTMGHKWFNPQLWKFREKHLRFWRFQLGVPKQAKNDSFLSLEFPRKYLRFWRFELRVRKPAKNDSVLSFEIFEKKIFIFRDSSWESESSPKIVHSSALKCPRKKYSFLEIRAESPKAGQKWFSPQLWNFREKNIRF